jgi:hypothetical protein
VTYRLRACPKCAGALCREGDDWSCLACGFVVYGSEPLPYVWPRKENAANPLR